MAQPRAVAACLPGRRKGWQLGSRILNPGCYPLGVYDSELKSPPERLESVGDTQFDVGPSEVKVHCALADAEHTGNFVGASAVENQAQDLTLSVG
jgi:hypothetical protein